MFSSSCVEVMCLLRLCSSVKVASQYLHLIGTFPFSWALFLCLFSVLEETKYALQSVHWNGFLPSWTEAMCEFKILFSGKQEAQIWHLNGLFFSWTKEIWRISFCLAEKDLPHTLHLNGFTPSWTDCKCLHSVLIRNLTKVWKTKTGPLQDDIEILNWCSSKS